MPKDHLGSTLKFLLIVLISCYCIITWGNETPQVSSLSKKKEVHKKQLPKLLDLGAKKCVPCKKMAPILVELEKEYRGVFDVEFVDVWQPENRERALKHKVSAIPTQIFFDANGKELWRHEGFISKTDMLKKWDELGYEFKPIISKSNPEDSGPS